MGEVSDGWVGLVTGGWGRGRWEEEVCVVAIYLHCTVTPPSLTLPLS